MLVAAPRWKLWPEKFPIMTGEARTQHSQVAKVACARGRLSAWRKRGLPALLFNWQISHQSVNGAKRVIPSADMNVTTLVIRISLGSFYMKAQARRSHLFYFYFILLFCHTRWITSRIKTVVNRLINIKFKICALLGRSDCGGEISEKLSLWGIEISPHGQFKY